jgi:integrase
METQEELNKDVANEKFRDFANSWVETKRVSVEYSTYSRYKHSLDYVILPFFGELKFNHISEDVLNKFIQSLVDRGLAPSTIRRAWISTKIILKCAAKKNGFDFNISEDIKLPPMTSNAKTWNEEEIEIFLDAPKRLSRLSRHYEACAFALLTGMRKQEVLGIRWRDINFKEKICHIQQTVVLTKDGYDVASKGKTQSSLGKVFLPDKAIEVLKRQKENIEREKILAGSDYTDLDLIFCRKNGGVIKPTLINSGFDNVIKALDLPKIRYHDLRHTHATYLLSKGINPKVVQERLRHKDIKTTLGIYGHATLTMQQEAAKLMDSNF